MLDGVDEAPAPAYFNDSISLPMPELTLMMDGQL